MVIFSIFFVTSNTLVSSQRGKKSDLLDPNSYGSLTYEMTRKWPGTCPSCWVQATNQNADGPMGPSFETVTFFCWAMRGISLVKSFLF